MSRFSIASMTDETLHVLLARYAQDDKDEPSTSSQIQPEPDAASVSDGNSLARFLEDKLAASLAPASPAPASPHKTPVRAATLGFNTSNLRSYQAAAALFNKDTKAPQLSSPPLRARSQSQAVKAHQETWRKGVVAGDGFWRQGVTEGDAELDEAAKASADSSMAVIDPVVPKKR